jgi:ATP-dependent helicase/nuclease subunit A
VLGLLLSGVSPEKILCLTFTNAAAAEMKNRVLEALGNWVMAEEKRLQAALAALLGRAPDAALLERARSLFALVLEAPEGIRIQTLHGFCQSLLARFPLEAGISPHFSLMEPRSADELLTEATHRLFSSTDEAAQAAIAELARTLHTDAFQALLKDIVRAKFAFQSLIRAPGGIPAAIDRLWNQLVVDRAATSESLIAQYFPYDKETESLFRQITVQLLEGKVTDQKRGKVLAAWFAEPDKRASMVEDYVRQFLKADYTLQSSLSTKGTLPENLETLLRREQERVIDFHNARSSLTIGKMTAAVLCLAERILSGYESLKQSHAKMDYDDLILTARDLLNRPGIAPWILYKLDGGIDHVLVDEAQDTSPAQWEIIQALTEDFFSGLSRSEAERSLFVVGDEKQSIYGFQGADVRRLAAAEQYFQARITAAGKTFATERLIQSYRSVPHVLQAVDATFATAEARAGVVAGDTTLLHTAHRQGEKGLVELWPILKTKDDGSVSAVTQLTRLIADTIRQNIDEGRWKPGEIMILVRKRNPFADRLVRALKRRRVPVAGADRMVLTQNLAAQDLIALGKCLLLPEDDLTLAALLKSPFAGYSEDALFTLAWDRGKTPLWERLRMHDPNTYARLADLRKKTDYLRPYELYVYALDTLGLRRKITGRMGEEYAEAVDEFLAQALAYEKDNPPSLQGFLHWLESSDAEIKRDMEEMSDKVRILTAHGAKGLQSKIVILPDTVSLPVPKNTLLWQGDIPLWSISAAQDNTLCAGLRSAKKDAEMEEYRRLLYVAMTRAEDELYICGATGKDTINEECWYSLVSRALSPIAASCPTPAGEGWRLGDIPVRREKREGGRIDSPNIPSAEKLAFLMQSPPAEAVPPKPLAPSALGEEPPALSPLSGDSLARGNFIHALLQYLPSLPEGRRKEAARALAVPHRATMPDDDIEACIREAIAVMENPFFAAVFAEGSLAEVPIIGIANLKGQPYVVSGRIDRLAIGVREVWLVDYKTNRRPPVTAADIPKAYVRQMALYRHLLKRIYPEKTVRAALVWTAVPRMDVLDESLLGTYI